MDRAESKNEIRLVINRQLRNAPLVAIANNNALVSFVSFIVDLNLV